ncbi:unnamed protein product, partial [Brassica rapa]
TDVLCVLNRQPTWAKVTQTVHEKDQCAESKDQQADMCTDGQPRTHRRPVCADGHTRTHTHTATDVLCVLTDTHGHPVYVLCVLNKQPTWAKITQTVHGKGQRAESKDQRADMCTGGQPRTSCALCVCRRTHTDVLGVLTDTHGRPVQPTWAKITRTVHGKGQRAESK